MMTPQEVSEHAFSKASFGGYSMAMVDQFLDVLTEDYTALYKENAILKSKMKVLVDKVEEYRSTEDAMRKALLTAQRIADELVAEAEAKRDELLAGAEQEARKRISALEREFANEQARLTSARKSTADFVGQAMELCRREVEYLSTLGGVTAPPPAPADPVDTAAQEIEQSLEKLVTRATAPQEEVPGDEEDTMDLSGPAGAASVEASAQEREGGLYAELLELNLQTREAGPRAARPTRRPLEEEPAEAEKEDSSPTRRIDFSNLQFGKDYEIR